MSNDAPYCPRTLMLGIANPNTIPRLIALAACVRGVSECELVAAHVVTVPSQMALESARSSPEVRAASELLGRAIQAGADVGVPVRGVVEVGREIHESLGYAAEKRDADLLIMGYSPAGSSDAERAEKAEKAFDRLMHRVAHSTACSVVVAKFRKAETARVLVPLAAEMNMPVIGLLARALADGADAEVEFLHVVDPDAEESEEAARTRIAGILAKHGLSGRGDIRVVTADNHTERIVEESESFDMIIVGATARSFADAIFGGTAEKIADAAKCSVLLVRAKQR